MLHWVLRRRSRPLQLSPRGVIVILAPHPDDETFGCGGLIAAHAAGGAPISIVFLTNGEASHPGHPLVPPVDLGALRVAEARIATRHLGLPPAALHFLNLPDGRLDQLHSAEQNDAIMRIADLLQSLRPDTILAPWRHDGSSEHAAAFDLVRHALHTNSFASPQLLEYPVWSAWSPRLLARLCFAQGRLQHFPVFNPSQKTRAISAYRSQIEPVAPWQHPALPVGFASALAGTGEFYLKSIDA